MKWSTKHHQEYYGTPRKFFALFPVSLDCGHSVWLERYNGTLELSKGDKDTITRSHCKSCGRPDAVVKVRPPRPTPITGYQPSTPTIYPSKPTPPGPE